VGLLLIEGSTEAIRTLRDIAGLQVVD